MQMATIELCVKEVYSPGGTIPRDVRVRSDFSRFDPRPEVPHFSNFGPPMERRPVVVVVVVGGGGGLRCAEPAYFTQSCRQVADFSRFGAHLRPAAHVSRFDPKVRPIPHLSSAQSLVPG